MQYNLTEDDKKLVQVYMRAALEEKHRNTEHTPQLTEDFLAYLEQINPDIESSLLGELEYYIEHIQQEKIKHVCFRCGSERVETTAIVSWNIKEQRWDVVEITEASWCNTCDRETKLDVVQVHRSKEE